MAQVKLLPIDAKAKDPEGTGLPAQRPSNVNDFGMGDPLYHDAARLRVLVERHKLHTGSALATALLEDWDNALGKFVKVMPLDYERALKSQEEERENAASVAAE